MRIGWKRTLSALLVIALMASLLIVPAAAAEVTETTTYNFQSDEFRGCGVPEAEGDFTWETSTGTVTGTNAFIQSNNNYGVLLSNRGTLTIPVTGNCDLTVTYKQRSHLMLGDQAAGEELGNSNTETATVHYAQWEEGVTSVTLTSTGGQSYILSISVGPYTEPEPSLKLSEASASLMEGGEAATVTAAISYAEAASVKAEAAAAGIVTPTAELNADKTGATITLTPVAAGNTTVTVTVTLTGESTLTGEIDVTVAPAKDPDATIAEGEYIFDGKNAYGTDAAIARVGGLDVGELKVQDNTGSNNHGLVIASGSSIDVNLAGKATITVFGCQYGAGTNMAMESSSGTVTASTGTNSMNETAPKFVVDGATGKTTLTFTSSDGKSSWLHSLKVEYEPESSVDSSKKRIGVWDLAGKLETDTSLYTNHITPELLSGASWSDGSGKFLQAGGNLGGSVQNKTVDLGGLIFAAGNSDKFYSNVDTLASYTTSATDTKYIGHDFGDGYVSAGGIFTNGTGNATRRNLTIPGVRKGDTVVAYLGNNAENTVFTVDEVSDATVTIASGQFGILSFIAPQAGSYKIRGDVGKPGYLRVLVIPPVTVSGSITLPAAFDATGWNLQFTNADTRDVAVATVNDDGTYTVELAPGHTYNASLKGANGWGMTSETKRVSPARANITTGLEHDLVVEPKSQYTYSGTITGFAEGYDTSKLAITMIPDEDSKAGSGAEDVELTLTGMSFTALLDPSVIYTLEMTGVNDYQIATPVQVTSEGEAMTGQTIKVEPKALVPASGKFVVLDEDDQFAPLYEDSSYAPLPGTVTALSFKNVDDGYTYNAKVENGGYTVSLRAGAYEAVATVDGYKTSGHVVVADKAVTKDLLFVSTAAPGAVEYAGDIYVDGVGGTDLHFKTVTGAMAYIKRMASRGDQRVTVHIAPGTYREQISIDSKNVSFVNDNPAKDVVLTWYYGIGYTYYSASTNNDANSRWYDAGNAFDKYALDNINIARWGCTVRVQAPGFQAQDIIFENSFNYYLTDEELSDGVTPSGKESITFAREYGADVTSKAATERAAVLWVETNSGRGDMTEFKNCKFLSSQDTLITGKRMYFKDCYIEGMTDYICGPGDVVFDTCTLNWKGYSDSTNGGYVTAPQTTADETGYLFRNCYITGDTDGLQLGGGGLGRTWGKEYTGCVFLNTTLQSAGLITEPTWAALNEFSPSDATRIHEWGTALLDGAPVDLSKRQLQNTVATAAPAVDIQRDYFGTGWIPAYYTAEVEGVALKAAPTVSDNGDINLPRNGHTLTVVYTLAPEANDANDASLIQWYRVAGDGAETLLKTAINAADKTYYIQEGDAGSHIKVTVTPKTIGGQTGEPMSYTVPEAVLEGYEDPTGQSDPVLGSGVNVYLAGDSTVMDYSASGMHNSGAMRPEGSWGEWIQQFFNDKVTIVNYAKGGRTTRQFIEDDGFLDKIDATMKEGDFLFIQFGHNDCYSADSRYVPLGIAVGDAQKSYAEGGVYPDKTADGKTTYTGYLKQYIAVTEKHGATAVLMTPVSRGPGYFRDGKIRAHHDASVDNTNDNEYCKAVKWVYDWAVDQGYNVAFQDNFQLTVDLFETAYDACPENDKQTYVKQIFGVDEGTHNNKLGGLIEAAVIAQAIQNSDLTIAKAVKAPAQIQGKTPEGETVFTVNGSGVLAAFDMLSTPAYAGHAAYWESEGQAMFDAIAAKAEELNGGQEEEPDTYGITITVTPTGTATVTGLPTGNKAEAGASVQFTVQAANGYELVSVTMNGTSLTAADGKYSFEMPAAAVAIVVTTRETGGGGINPPTGTDKTALNKAITDAEAKMETIYTASDNTKVTDVAKGREFITNTGKAAVQRAIADAKEIAGKDDATQEEVDDALAALNKALTDNVKTGTKSTGGGSSSSSSGSSSTGSTGSSTTTNTDGSNTTTTTDRTTGTVTETTKNTDGSTSVKETKTDGTVTETITKTDGSSTAVETKTDGTVTTTEKAANGVEAKTVSQPGKSVTASVTIPSTVESAVVTIPDAEVTPGTVAVDADTGEIIKLSVPTGDGLAVKLDSSRNIILVDNSIHFNDVSDVGHWAENYVAFVSSHELFVGTSENTFAPESNTSRAQLMTVLARLDGADTNGDALQKGMEWAVQTGISDGSNPDENISRQQVAVMLWRYAGSPESSQALSSADAGDIADYAQTALAWAVEKGILNGYPDGTLKPGDSASRAHVAAMVQRFCVILV